MPACATCGCDRVGGAAQHAIAAALARDDLDQALELGLLDAPTCATCRPACTALLLQARQVRIAALAARDRHRARTARLEARRQARAQRRGEVPAGTSTGMPAGSPAPATPRPLPAAAAAALARAKARAAGKP